MAQSQVLYRIISNYNNYKVSLFINQWEEVETRQQSMLGTRFSEVETRVDGEDSIQQHLSAREGCHVTRGRVHQRCSITKDALQLKMLYITKDAL